MLTPADTYGADELAALFTAVYEGYWFPVRLDAAAFAAMVEQGDIKLGRSRVALEGGSPSGIVLLGVRGETGWIGGMGVVPAHRRRGLGEALMRGAIDAARERGLREVTLEVLEQNEPALRLYERLGFERTREVEVRSAQAAGAPSTAFPVDDAQAWIAAARSSPEPWQRADETLAWFGRQDPAPVALAVGEALRALGGTVAARQHEMALRL